MITWNRYISDGSFTLSHALTVAIYDYQRAFGREPGAIVIPFWRGHEMGDKFLDDCCAPDADMKFRGIPLLLSIESDYIELR